MDINERVTQLGSYNKADFESRLNDTLYVALPEKFDVTYVIASLIKLAEEYELEIPTGELRNAYDVNTETLRQRTIEMEVVGEREQWEGFLEAVHGLAPLVRINELEVDFDVNDPDLLVSNIVFDTYALSGGDFEVEDMTSVEIPVFTAVDEQLFNDLRDLRVIDPSDLEELVGRENPFEE